MGGGGGGGAGYATAGKPFCIEQELISSESINQHLFLFRKIFCKMYKHTKLSSKMRQKKKLQNNHF